MAPPGVQVTPSADESRATVQVAAVPMTFQVILWKPMPVPMLGIALDEVTAVNVKDSRPFWAIAGPARARASAATKKSFRARAIETLYNGRAD
jgi:hypothetical protein